MDTPRRLRERVLQQPAALDLRARAEIVAVAGEQVERDEGRGRLLGELRYPGRRRVEPQLQGIEVEPAVGRDHDLAVDHAARGEARAQLRLELREVSVERPQVAALEVEPVAIAEDDGPEAVPLGLEEPPLARGQRRRELREHRLDRRLDREPLRHHRPPARRAAIRPPADAQPASKGWPTSSRSTTSGAWSDGMGFPFRASRSISAHTVRPPTGRVSSTGSIRMPNSILK